MSKKTLLSYDIEDYRLDMLAKIINVNKIGALLAEEDKEWNDIFHDAFTKAAQKLIKDGLIDQKTFDFFNEDRLDSHSPCSVEYIKRIRDNTFTNKYKIPNQFISNE